MSLNESELIEEAAEMAKSFMYKTSDRREVLLLKLAAALENAGTTRAEDALYVKRMEVTAAPRVVTTETDLCMLPDKSVVLSDGIAYQKASGADWDGLGRGWHVSQIDLPALVLHVPEVTK